MDECMALDELHKQNSSLCVCLKSGHQVAWRTIHFRKNRFSYACNLQQCGGIKVVCRSAWNARCVLRLLEG